MQERFGFTTGEGSAQFDGSSSDRRITDQPVDWRLDEETRQLGRRGIAAARERLAACGRSTRHQLSDAA